MMIRNRNSHLAVDSDHQPFEPYKITTHSSNRGYPPHTILSISGFAFFIALGREVAFSCYHCLFSIRSYSLPATEIWNCNYSSLPPYLGFLSPCSSCTYGIQHKCANFTLQFGISVLPRAQVSDFYTANSKSRLTPIVPMMVDLQKFSFLPELISLPPHTLSYYSDNPRSSSHILLFALDTRTPYWNYFNFPSPAFLSLWQVSLFSAPTGSSLSQLIVDSSLWLSPILVLFRSGDAWFVSFHYPFCLSICSVPLLFVM